MNSPGTCIFCLKPGPFEKIEHPIPESLGNDDLTMATGFVCDLCNQYFGTKIEREVLASPPWSVERTAACVRTKKGKLPKHVDKQVRLYSTGFWDKVILECDSASSFPFITGSNNTGLLLINQAPRSDELIARFLLKMGLELLVPTSLDVRAPSFDRAREYARFGRCARKWEVAYGLYPNRKKLVLNSREDELGPLETRQLYQYELGQMEDGRIIFFFEYITHVFAVCLTEDRLGPYLEGFNHMNHFILRSNVDG